MSLTKAGVSLLSGIFLLTGFAHSQIVLDDFESGAKAPNKLGGIWYTFGDKTSSTNPGMSMDSIFWGCTDVYGPPSTKSINIKFVLNDTLASPECGFGTYLNAAKTCANLSSYGGITIHYKGPFLQSGYVILRIEDSTTLAANPTKSSYYYTSLVSSTLGWDTVTVPWTTFAFSGFAGSTPPLTGLDLTRVVKISFQFKGIVSFPDTDQFYLDDIILQPAASAIVQKTENNVHRPLIAFTVGRLGSLTISGIVAPSRLTILDLEGRIVALSDIRKNGVVPIGSLRPGVYSGTIKNSEQSAESRFTITR